VKIIIVPDSIVTAKAAKAATSKIPIVFGIGADPVKAGLVPSLSHPGGNLTGASRLNVELEPKRLELLHELVPNAKIFGLLINPGNPNAIPSAKDTESAAHLLGVSLYVLHASNNRDIDLVFAELAVLGIGGLVIAPDPFFLACSRQLAELTLRYRIPAIFEYREFVTYGGLASYAGNPMEGYRLIGLYAARILRGEKPENLPIQQYAKIELIVNLRTASFLEIDVPPSILFRADEVIENELSLAGAPK
jgi:putative ABC transport system substrate-binding protein